MKNKITKTLSQLIVALSILLSIISCSKNDEPVAPDPNPFQYRVKSYTDTNSPGYIFEFEYNNNNQLTKKKEYGNPTTYLYNTAGFLVEKNYYNGETTSFTNDNSGKVLEQIDYAAGGGTSSKLVFTYNTAGNKTEEKKYNYINNNYVYYYNKEFLYNTQNQLSAKRTPQYTNTNGTLYQTEVEEYEYDNRGNQNKITYARSQGGFPVRYREEKYVYDNVKPAPYLNSTLSKNNKIEEVITLYANDGTTISTQSTTIYTQTYNEASYITKTIRSDGFSKTYTLEKIN